MIRRESLTEINIGDDTWGDEKDLIGLASCIYLSTSSRDRYWGDKEEMTSCGMLCSYGEVSVYKAKERMKRYRNYTHVP